MGRSQIYVLQGTTLGQMAIVTGLAYCNSVQYQTKHGSPEKNTHNMLQQREELSSFSRLTTFTMPNRITNKSDWSNVGIVSWLMVATVVIW